MMGRTRTRGTRRDGASRMLAVAAVLSLVLLGTTASGKHGGRIKLTAGRRRTFLPRSLQYSGTATAAATGTGTGMTTIVLSEELRGGASSSSSEASETSESSETTEAAHKAEAAAGDHQDSASGRAADETIARYVASVDRSDDLKRSEKLYDEMVEGEKEAEEVAELELELRSVAKEDEVEQEQEEDDDGEKGERDSDEGSDDDDDDDEDNSDDNAHVSTKNLRPKSKSHSHRRRSSSASSKRKNKKHPRKNKDGRRSNAVGDPDGNSSSSEEDDTTGTEELSELTEFGLDFDEINQATNAIRSQMDELGVDMDMEILEHQKDLDVAEIDESEGDVEEASAAADHTAAAAEEVSIEVTTSTVGTATEEDDDDGELSPSSNTKASKTNGGGGGGNGGGDDSTGDKDTNNNLDATTDSDATAAISDSMASRARARQSLRDFEDSQTQAFETALVKAFLPHLYLPPPSAALEMMRASSRQVDVAGRRRLDRRSLYQGLLVELTHAHAHAHEKEAAEGSSNKKSKKKKKKKSIPPPKRRFLDPAATRSLRSALSLASMPKWRKHVARQSLNAKESDAENAAAHPNILRLYPTDEELIAAHQRARMAAAAAAASAEGGGSGGMPGMPGMNMNWNPMAPQQNNQGDEEDGDDNSGAGAGADGLSSGGNGDTTALDNGMCTLSMQESTAMALAHSLGVGTFLLDDEAVDDIRQTLLNNSDLQLDSSSSKLRQARILDALCRLAEEGRFAPYLPESGGNQASAGRISTRMERDLTLGLDDSCDHLAVESFKLMKDDEESWYGSSENENTADDEAKDDQSTATARPLPLLIFLRTSTSPNILKSRSTVDLIARESVRPDSIHLICLGRGIDASTDDIRELPANAVGSAIQRMGSGNEQARSLQAPPSSTANINNNPFAGMSSRLPPPGAAFNPNGNAPFNQQNINASGINDPPGSSRFNIFLARTVDSNGNPGIMGAIAPPSAGNLFPKMFQGIQQQLQHLQNQETSSADDGSQEGKANWADLMQRQLQQFHEQQQQQQQGSSAEGQGDGKTLQPQFFNASIAAPSDSVQDQQANGAPTLPPELVQQAIQEALNSVIERLARANDAGEPSGLPPALSKVFSEMLRSPMLRQNLSMNLQKAAPALIDPRCQGIMLSVYVPPSVGPTKGMLPGQHKAKQNGGNKLQDSPAADQQTTKDGKSWLNKVMSSKGSSATDDDEDASDNEEDDEEIFIEGESNEVEQSDDDDIVDLDEEAEVVEREEVAANFDDNEEEEEEEEEVEDDQEEEHTEKGKKRKRRSKNKRHRMKNKLSSTKNRIRNLAAAATMVKAQKQELEEKKAELAKKTMQSNVSSQQKTAAKVRRNLKRLEAIARPNSIASPTDPVRSRSWKDWVARETGAVIFRSNRRALNAELDHRNLEISGKTGSQGAGSVIRQMLSVRDLSDNMEEIVRTAVELEAARSARLQESPWDQSDIDKTKIVDTSLEQIVISSKTAEDEDVGQASKQSIHPISLESAISLVCKISPTPSGGVASSSAVTGAGGSAHLRSKEDLSALASDKHERALIANVVLPHQIGISYDMIGGLDSVKELLRQSITYPLKYPHLYSEGIAKEAVKGVLLFGPPGTGKTMLAKAVATEGGATFLSIDASSIENKWLGESEKNAKAVFTLARRLAPCVIFIDEVDSILSSREGSSDDSAHGTLTSVKTTLMQEWDGLGSGEQNGRVIVIGSTNRPFDLDDAVLRRFPRRILVDLPDRDTRQEILEVTLSENRLANDVNLTAIAERLDGYTGSDIKEVAREAVVQISHEQAQILDQGFLDGDEFDELDEDDDNSAVMPSSQRLRPCTMEDIESAMNKVKKSVSEKGRELLKVIEWNEEYGEIKRQKKATDTPTLNMFL